MLEQEKEREREREGETDPMTLLATWAHRWVCKHVHMCVCVCNLCCVLLRGFIMILIPMITADNS